MKEIGGGGLKEVGGFKGGLKEVGDECRGRVAGCIPFSPLWIHHREDTDTMSLYHETDHRSNHQIPGDTVS